MGYRCSSLHAWLQIIKAITYAPGISSRVARYFVTPAESVSFHSGQYYDLCPSVQVLCSYIDIDSTTLKIHLWRQPKIKLNHSRFVDLKISSSKFPDLQIYWILFVLYNISSHCDGTKLFFHDYHYSEVLSILFI